MTRSQTIFLAFFALACNQPPSGNATDTAPKTSAAPSPKTPPSTAPSTASASSSVPAPSGSAATSAKGLTLSATAVPAAFVGTYAISEAPEGKESTLTIADIGDNSIKSQRVVARSADPIADVVFTPDGHTLVYATKHGSGDDQKQTLHAVGVDGSGEHTIATCDAFCSLGGVDQKGDVWYVNQAPSRIGKVQHVSLKGGAAVDYPPTFSTCLVTLKVTPDGQLLLIGVDNSLGWPECINDKKRGFYIVHLNDAAKADKLPPATSCYGSKAHDVNFQDFELVGTDRVWLDVQSFEKDPPVSETWSCGADGTGAKKEKPKMTAQILAPAQGEEGEGWLVLAPGPSFQNKDAQKLIGPHVTGFAFRPAESH